MRIVKTQALVSLQGENALLCAQEAKCRGQIGKLSNVGLESMSGAGVRAARQRFRMQAAIGMAHLAFYDSLYQANQKNLGLLNALPETSYGVLDTVVAQDRIDAASRQIHNLEQQMQAALERAQRINESLRQTMVANPLGGVGAALELINTNTITQHYQTLISSQQLVMQVNQKILEQARAYERASLETYRSVETSYLNQAMDSSKTFLSTGDWGNVAWVARLCATLVVRQSAGVSVGRHAEGELVEGLLRGDVKVAGSVLSQELSTNATLMGIVLSGAASGEVLGFVASIKPYEKGSRDTDKEDGASISIGSKAQVEAYGAKAKLEGSAGIVEADTEYTLLTGAISGTLGVSFLREGELSPALEGGAKAEASVFEAESGVRVGNEDYNAHAKAEGKLFTAEAESKVRLGADGVEAKAGAEAYVATGEASGGITILGITVDASVEAKAGGAGIKAGGALGATSAEGELGVGLGLGLGVKLKVDWSSAVNVLEELGGIGDWWNGIWNA